MSIITAVPWGLLLPAGALVVLATSGNADRAPEAATTSQYTWTTVHRHGGEVRGPRGLGVFLGGIAQRGNLVLATAPNQSFRSTDSGRTWHEIPALRRVFDVAIGDSGLALAGSFGGEIQRSVDSGQTWSTIKTPAEGLVLGLVVDGDSAFAVARGAILRTGDRGKTWVRSPTLSTGLADFGRAGRTMLAVGSAGLVARSEDGGVTFTTSWAPTREASVAVAFADERTAVIVGTNGSILRSVDAGLTWTPVQSPTTADLRGVAFASPTEGMAVGLWGEAIRSTDGGATWTREATGTRLHLQAVTVRPEGGFMVAGGRERIMIAARAVP